MAGLEAKPVYLYDETGAYIREFESISEFARHFSFPDNIFSREYVNDVYEFVDGRVAALYRIGREGIRRYKEYKNNEFVGQGRAIAETVYAKNGKGEVVLTDLDNVEIARFKSIFHAAKIVGDNNAFRHGKVGKKVKSDRGYYIEILPLKDS